MPTVSEFGGITIRINPEPGEKHQEPHFHTFYGDSEASFSIITLEVLAKSKNFSSKTAAEVKEWAMAHRKQLKKNWYRIKYHKSAIKI